MENPCKLLFFGDSITKGYAPRLEKKLRDNYPEVVLTVVHAGVSGETSRDGLTRIPGLLDERPDLVVIGFGMNDWRKGVDREEYKKNLIQMLISFEKIGARVILNTVSPSYDFQKKRYNPQVDDYSEAVREIAREKKIKIADINDLWKKTFPKPEKALRDDIHPNEEGYELICKCLLWFVPRKYTTILWQYNGREAICNYRCHYCYYIGLHSSRDRFVGTMEQWHGAFKEAFRNQHLIFYLAFGEPTIGKEFCNILRMIDEEKKWQIRITSNVSHNLEHIVKSKSAQEGKLNINASFHPSMIKKEEFLKQLIFLRVNGIDVPIVYVAHPIYLINFEEDIEYFRKHGFVVHVRRFQGKIGNNIYPGSYTHEEMKLIAKYSDDGMIKYMLNQQCYAGELSFAGTHFFIVDNAGNVGYDSNAFQEYTVLRAILGNIHSGNFRPNFLPSPYPGKVIGTVDGIANIIKNNYKELENNNVLSFARQGGVYKDAQGNVVYGNEFKDFDDPAIRAEYNFSPINFDGKRDSASSIKGMKRRISKLLKKFKR